MTVVSLKAAHGDVVIPASSKENIFMSTRSQYGLRDMISKLSCSSSRGIKLHPPQNIQGTFCPVVVKSWEP